MKSIHSTIRPVLSPAYGFITQIYVGPLARNTALYWRYTYNLSLARRMRDAPGWLDQAL